MNHYPTSVKFLHWLISPLVILMLVAGFLLEDLPKEWQGTAYMMHKSVGITLLFLMLFRFFWVRHVGKPSLPDTVPFWQRTLARTVQYLLYFFVIAMPIAGWVMSMAADKVPSYFGLFALPLPGVPVDKSLASLMNKTHEYIAFILIGLIVLHVAGALKHHFIDKDDVLKRML